MPLPRKLYYLLTFFGFFAILGLWWLQMEMAFWIALFWAPYALLGWHDMYSNHNILRNYPVIGHLRFFFEFIRPEIHQYFIESNTNGAPYNRQERSIVYRRAKNLEDTHPFGTEMNVNAQGYEYAAHSMNTQKVDAQHAYVEVGGDACLKKYKASILNISGMSYGAISKNAVLAMNLGAKLGGFFQNTGEGGITGHHLQHGGDLVWQLGTGYFGARNSEGGFDSVQFMEKSRLDVVKMIEIKISQGAKPSHGGLLPAEKITEEISEIRGIPMGEDCHSPDKHSAFQGPKGLLAFVQQLRDLSEGKPVGFKICIGIKAEFMSICKAMLEMEVYPDFIAVDGSEGGTGAAPLAFTNRLGVPGDEALAFVHNSLVGCGIRDKMRLIASGKVVSSFDIVKKCALGADMVNVARPFMFTVGCIQALHCNNNHCPTGVATTDPYRYSAIDVEAKSKRVWHFHDNTVKAFMELVGAMGFDAPKNLHADAIRLRNETLHSVSLATHYHFIQEGSLLGDQIPAYYAEDWQKASAEAFS